MNFKAEYEARFLNIERRWLVENLKVLQIVRHEPAALMCRCLFDSPERRLFNSGAWLRVREEGATVTRCSLTFSEQRLPMFTNGVGGD
jgi:hypothetical protein